MMREEKLKGFDPFAMFGKIWGNRRRLLVWMLVGLVVGFIISWSIPTTYSTVIKVVPDKSTIESSNFISDVIKSRPFLLAYWDMKVSKAGEDTDMLLRDYVLEEQRYPWWKNALELPSKIKQWRRGKPVYVDSVNIFHIAPEQVTFVDRMIKNIKLQIDKHNGVLNLTVTMQDPLISAVVADRILHDMQDVVMEKKTFKAASDVQAYEKMLQVARLSYTEKQTELAGYIKAENINELSTLRQAFFKQEMETVYKPYLSMMEAVDKAKMKVQEDSPSFAVIEPASVPTYPSGPRTLLNVLGSIFIFCFCGVIVLLFKGMDK